MFVAAILRYPIKGLPGELLCRTLLTPGRAIPHDRGYALAHGRSMVAPGQTTWARADQFEQLKNNALLARLGVRLDADAPRIELTAPDSETVAARLDQPADRAVVEAFVARHAPDPERGRPRLTGAAIGSFGDEREMLVSIHSRTTLDALSESAGAAIDMARFRGNLVIDEVAPWAEFDWPGRTLAIGAARLQIVKRIERCVATTVNPASGARDLNVPKLLARVAGTVEFGVYARVIVGGEIAPGDQIRLV